MVLWSYHIIRHYWYRLTAVARTGRYYATSLRSFQRLTQEYPFSPTIFNKVVDAVVRNWVSLVLGGVAELDGRGKEVLYCDTLFYA